MESVPGTTIQAGTSNPVLMDNDKIAPVNSNGSPFPSTVGTTTVNVAADKIWVIMHSVLTLKADAGYSFPLNPYYFNTVSATTPSQAQVEAMRHVFIAPNERRKFVNVKLTSVANAFVNGRLIIAHIPYGFPISKVEKMSVAELSQFNRTEHVLHGPDTFMEVDYTVPLPYLKSYDPDDVNGYLYVRVVEFSKASDTASDPQFTLWVNVDPLRFTHPNPPVTYQVLTRKPKAEPPMPSSMIYELRKLYEYIGLITIEEAAGRISIERAQELLDRIFARYGISQAP